MKRKIKQIILLLLVIPVALSFVSGGSTTDNKVLCRKVIHNMFDSIKNVRTVRYLLSASERINGKLVSAQSIMKIHVNPRKVYLLNPVKGLEILWHHGENATVKTKTIPFVNLSLDPLGNLMRKDQHHTLHELGYTFVGTTIASGVLKAGKDFDKHFTYIGPVTWDKIECYYIEVNFPDYHYYTYTTGKNETVTSIATKLNAPDFKIRYKNELSSYFGAIKEGKKLLIPNVYSKRTLLYIDKKTNLPLCIKVYDEDGLYESYEMYNMKANGSFAIDEFSKSFKGYGF